MNNKKKTIALFGGTGGLGNQLIKYLKEYNVIPLGSKSVDIQNFNSVEKFFKNNDVDIVINMMAETSNVQNNDLS